MPALSPFMHKYTQDGGDTLLLQALKDIPVYETGRNSYAWLTSNGQQATYHEALADRMRVLNDQYAQQGQQISPHEFEAKEVKKRLEGLDFQIARRSTRTRNQSAEFKRNARIAALENPEDFASAPTLRALSPPAPLEPNAYASGPSGSYGDYSRQEEAYPEGVAQSAPLTLQPPYTGPPGPSNPYNSHYRSLGHDRFASSIGRFTRPLRHAAIYGDTPRRF
ncbi:hypothetical protein JCM8547_005668 [Rhodosporidiobolus lusitaniae]